MQLIQNSMTKADEEEFFYRKRAERNQWYDEECNGNVVSDTKNVDIYFSIILVAGEPCEGIILQLITDDGAECPSVNPDEIKTTKLQMQMGFRNSCIAVEEGN